jgi:hypothetical protein
MANKNSSVSVGVKVKQYAASGSPRDLAADSPDGFTSARMLKILGAGSFTSTLDAAGGNMGTLGPLAAGDEIPAEVSSVISADAAFIAFW